MCCFSAATGNADGAPEIIHANVAGLRDILAQMEAESGQKKAEKAFVRTLTDELIIAGNRAVGRSPGSARELDKFGREALNLVIRPQ